MPMTKEQAAEVLRNTKVNKAGKIIAEADGPGWMIMFPTGQIVSSPNRASAERRIKNWMTREMRRTGSGMNVAEVEWRG